MMLSVAEAEVAVQQLLDDTARGFKFNDMASAVSYADEPAVPLFMLQGRALRRWRSIVWAFCYSLLATGAVGTKEELLAALPKLQMDTTELPPPEADAPPIPEEALPVDDLIGVAV